MHKPKSEDVEATLGTPVEWTTPHESHAPRASPVSTKPASLLGGRYEILALLGTGGMGSVYRALDTELDEIVALKMLRSELAEQPEILARFRREAKLARRVTHPNVARMFDIGEHEGEKFLTMEFVDGESLASLLQREGALPLDRVSTIGLAICAALSAAHTAGVIHRDLKPDNVLLAKDGRVLVSDFGIARAAIEIGALRTLGSGVGTPAYMAPEQVRGAAQIDARADVYSFGILLFELLTGERAWPGDSAIAVASARLSEPPPDPRSKRDALPDSIADVAMRCMAREPDGRYASAEEVAQAIRRALETPTAQRIVAAPPVKRASVSPPPVATPHAEKTIAVLPFRHTGPTDLDYLADGLTEDLIDTLSTTRGLRVRPRGLVMRMKGRDGDAREIGRELGVQVVVDGSVRSAGEKLRVSVRLISVTDGFQLWAKRFDCTTETLLSVSDSAARAIGEALTVDPHSRERQGPVDRVAIELYLRALYELRRAWNSDVSTAVDLFEKALAYAPNDPSIVSAYALASARLAMLGGVSQTGAREPVVRLAERAVSLAPHHPEAWIALARAKMNECDPVGAVQAVRAGIDRAPAAAPLQAFLGGLLAEVGRVDEALVRLTAALALDPTDVMPRWDLARIHAALGEFDQSEALLGKVEDHAAEIARVHMRARLSLWCGDRPLAEEHVPEIDAGALSVARILHEVHETRALSEANLAFLRGYAVRRGVRLQILLAQIEAEVFGFLGDVSQSIAAATRAVDCGLFDLMWIDRCPPLAAARQDARFAELRARVLERVQPIIAALDGD